MRRVQLKRGPVGKSLATGQTSQHGKKPKTKGEWSLGCPTGSLAGWASGRNPAVPPIHRLDYALLFVNFRVVD